MNKEEMTGLKKSNRVAIIIMMVLVAIGLISSVFDIVEGLQNTYPAIIIAKLVMYILVAYYGLWGYKKPHGNLLKYLMLAFGITLITPVILADSSHLRQIIYPIAILLIGYMSGRLYKYKENRIIAIIVTVLLVFLFIMKVVDPGSEIRLVAIDNPFNLLISLDPTILWLAIYVSYSSRYRLHKEAGLQDKPA